MEWNRRTYFSRALALMLCLMMLFTCALPAAAVSGHWISTKISTSYGNVNTHAFVLDTPATKCTSFDLDVEIDMKKNTKCANWDIWVRSNGSFVKVSSLSLPGGNGSASKTVKLNPAKSFDAVAITPTQRGSYSWSMGMSVSNIVDSSSGSSTKSSNNLSKSTTEPSSSASSSDLLPGDFEKVKLKVNRSTYNVHAFVLDTPLRNIRSIGVAINVEMKKNTHCYDWAVWVRSNGSFKNVGSIYLPDGTGYKAETVYFNSPTSFDAICVIPTVPGGYSWSMGMGVYNPK